MSQAPTFVVIDFHPESRFLLVKTLQRKFPNATIYESDDAEKAIELVRAVNLAAVITHRTFEVEGVELVRMLRNADPKVPIVMVSGIDREAAALAAGANTFLHYDEWLRVGSVVDRNAAGRGLNGTTQARCSIAAPAFSFSAMMMMPGNDGSQLLGFLAGRYNRPDEPPRLGWLMGPKHWKEPRSYLPYALDNDCFTAGDNWSETAWLEMLERTRCCAQKPRWVLVPDVVGDAAGTLARWERYAPICRRYGWPLAFAAQDGLAANDVPSDADVVFIGGSTAWKWRTVAKWCDSFPRVHVGRVNTLERVWLCDDLGAESAEGTGWMKNPNRRDQMGALQEWLAGIRRPEQLELLPGHCSFF